MLSHGVVPYLHCRGSEEAWALSQQENNLIAFSSLKDKRKHIPEASAVQANLEPHSTYFPSPASCKIKRKAPSIVFIAICYLNVWLLSFLPVLPPRGQLNVTIMWWSKYAGCSIEDIKSCRSEMKHQINDYKQCFTAFIYLFFLFNLRIWRCWVTLDDVRSRTVAWPYTISNICFQNGSFLTASLMTSTREKLEEDVNLLYSNPEQVRVLEKKKVYLLPRQLQSTHKPDLEG